MKKKEKRYGILKGSLIFIIIGFLLSWIIPNGTLSSTGLVDAGMVRLGIYDIGDLFYNAFAVATYKIIILLAIAALYGVMTKTQGYERIVTYLAKKFSKHKQIVVVAVSVVLAGLTSVLTQTFVVLIFVPFIVSILNRMKLDKMTILATTIGSILVGIMGATYGTEGLQMLNYYFGYTTTLPYTMPALAVRAGILVIGLVLFNFFTLTHMRKVAKNAESVDWFEVTVEEGKENKTKSVVPIIVVLAVLFVLVFLGFMDWGANFGIEIFDEFHSVITEDIKIEASVEGGDDFFFLGDILGTDAPAFGLWNNLMIFGIVLIFTAIIGLCYRFKLDEFFDAIKEGVKKMFLPSLCIIGAYMLLMIVYRSPYVVTIVGKLLSLTDGFNIATMTLSSIILNIFHTDLSYTGYVVASYIPVEYADYINPVYTMLSSLYGLVQFFIPTSMVLGIGLVSFKVKLSDWLKYIWRFLVGMFICLLVIFILMSIL